MSHITLTTDFGLSDWFVGSMKGVIASIAPDACVIDITHGIEAGDISGGAFALLASTRYFPVGTVHVVVVDPGVGSLRGAIAAECDGHRFVAPDNGILSHVLPEGRAARIHRVENKRFLLEPVSRTFHGRDVFAPVGAHLSRGVTLEQLGPAVDAIVRLAFPCHRKVDAGIEGEVIYVDRFGNAITTIPEAAGPRQKSVSVAGRAIPVASCYADVPPGSPVAIFGSTGYLEIAINGGSAGRVLGLRRGSTVVLR